MKEEMCEILMSEKHLLSSDQKLEWWGYGEWVEEPDEVTFTYHGMDCKIIRMAIPEPCSKEVHVFGGYLCGYVAIPIGHPLYQKEYGDMDIDCHGGLTFGSCWDRHWIGFDCAHSFDYVPSSEHLRKTAAWMQECRELQACRELEEGLKKRLKLVNSPIFDRAYKNIEFCAGECVYIVDQLVEISGGTDES